MFACSHMTANHRSENSGGIETSKTFKDSQETIVHKNQLPSVIANWVLKCSVTIGILIRPGNYLSGFTVLSQNQKASFWNSMMLRRNLR